MLAKNPAHKIPDWHAHRLVNWTLWRAKDDKTKRVMDKNNNQIGWFLGEGVAKSGAYVGDPYILPYDMADPKNWQQAELEIEGIAGRYVVIIDAPEIQRVYGDPVGDFSTVYNKDEAIVASTTLLALTREIEWNPLFDRMRILSGEMHFSLQETPDVALKRALPNHYLCLNTFECVRHWPRADTRLFRPQISMEENLDEVSQRLSDIVGALARSQKVILPLSGGYDSRNIVGAAKEHLKHLQFSFSHQFHKMSRIDADIAAIISKRVGVPFKLIAFDASMKHSHDDRMRYFNRTGYADGGIAVRITRLEQAVPGNMLSLRGNVMELLRANQWSGRFASSEKPVTHFGIKRLLIDRAAPLFDVVDQWGEKYEAWRDTLPESAMRRSIDLAFAEHLLPNTLGVRHFGNVNNFVMNPFSDRRIMQLCMQIPPTVRKANIPNQYLLKRNCGHLSDIPFQRSVASDGTLLDKLAG
ncbi:MAG: hypothetical protein JKX71_06605 [Amylibacter sp.]|nr:hypothetical protein [Amylibacter sp.]